MIPQYITRLYDEINEAQAVVDMREYDVFDAQEELERALDDDCPDLEAKLRDEEAELFKAKAELERLHAKDEKLRAILEN